MTVQLPIPMRDRDRAELAACRVRRVCRAVAEEIGIKVLGDDWGCGHATVTHKLDETERRHLHPAELLDLVLRDRAGRIVAELLDLAGFEPPEPKHVLDAGEKFQRLESALGQTLGADVAEMIFRKAGLR